MLAIAWALNFLLGLGVALVPRWAALTFAHLALLAATILAIPAALISPFLLGASID